MIIFSYISFDCKNTSIFEIIDDKKAKEQGYLKLNTIHAGEAIIGYMNIKRKRGCSMIVNIPINGKIYSFEWDVAKK